MLPLLKVSSLLQVCSRFERDTTHAADAFLIIIVACTQKGHDFARASLVAAAEACPSPANTAVNTTTHHQPAYLRKLGNGPSIATHTHTPAEAEADVAVRPGPC